MAGRESEIAPRSRLLRDSQLYLVAIVLAVVAVLRIGATYGVLSQTWDEPAHIASGMEWLERGSYTYERQHPPLARIAVALGPYLSGIRIPTAYRLDSDGQRVSVVTDVKDRMWVEGNLILHSGGRYTRNLALARMGVLPFFLLGVVVVWLWAGRLFGRPAGLIAALIYTTSPNVLAHAGFATTDMIVTGAMLAAIYAFTVWIEKPTSKRSAWLGLAVGASVISKFSSLLLLPVCFLTVLGLRWVMSGEGLRARIEIGRGRWKGIAITALTTFGVCWAIYSFSLGPLTTAAAQQRALAEGTPGVVGVVKDYYYSVGQHPIFPLSELVDGVRAVAEHQSQGHRSYLFGEVREGGWWYYYPVAMFFKTPTAFLLLSAIGLLGLIGRPRSERSWQSVVPGACAALVVLAMIPSNINIGLRHVLLAYPLLAIVAGYGSTLLWSSPRRLIRYSLPVLLLAQVTASLVAHPDYLAYFNAFAGREPDRILVHGDLDWGQDMGRLARKVDELGIEELSLAYFGSAHPPLHMSIPIHRLMPGKPAAGWIAISRLRLRYDDTITPPFDGFAWLDEYTPVARVGKSILLYNVPDSPATRP